MSSAVPPSADAEEAKEMLEALNLQAGVAEMESGSEGEEGVVAVASGSGASGKSKKKRSRRKGKSGGAASSEAAFAPSVISSDVVEALAASGPAIPSGTSERLKALNKTLSGMTQESHAFWSTQPVPKLTEEVAPTEHCAIDEDKPVSELRQEPLGLPEGFVWSDIDLSNAAQLNEVYELLSENYVEDDDAMFRFNYAPEFLLWALTPPDYYREWHIGVRAARSGKLFGFISGIPAHISMWGRVKKMCEINFLCVHKKLRSKRLAPVLIKEVTRRVNLQGMFQAVYTAGTALPKPVSACQYWHRSLNIRKLVDVGFSRLPPKMTMNLTERLYKLDPTPKIPGIRPMEPKDVHACCILLNAYLKKFGLHTIMSDEEFAHFMLPRPGVISSFVVQDASGAITDLASFYHLPSTVIDNPKHKLLNAVYAYYTVPGKHTLEQLYGDLLILAKQEDKDVFNCLDMMDNAETFKTLKFGPGDGMLHYYLYNWKCPQMDNSMVGLILV